MSFISVESADGIAINKTEARVLFLASSRLARPPITGTPEIESRWVSGLSSIKPTGRYKDDGLRS